MVGHRPALPSELAAYNDYQRQRLLVKPGLTCYWQTRMNRDSISFDEWVDLDLWPDQFNACGFTFDVRLEYWAGILDERLHRKRQKVWDAGGTVDDAAGRVVSGVDGSTRVKTGLNGAAISAFAEYDEGYEMAGLLDAIDAALKHANASETDVYIFKQHFLEGREYQDIAAELGKANSSMTYAMKHVVQSVREYLRDAGYHA